MFDSGGGAPELTRTRWWLLPFAVLAGALSLLLWQVLLGDQSLFYRDLYRQHLGTARLLASGELPFGLLWDPLLNGGQPLLANPNRFLLYPSRLLYLIMGPIAALNWEITLHLLLGGSGAIAVARRLGLGRAASAVAGVSFALSGLSISLTNHLGRLLAYHWIPWIVLATHVACHDTTSTAKRRVATVFAGFFLALQWLTGAAEVAGLAAVTVVAWSVVCSGSGRRRSGPLVVAGAAIVIGGALAAIQVLPSAEMVMRSERALGTPAEMSLTWSMHPLRIVEFAIPGFLGPVDVANPSATFWGAPVVDFGFPYFLSLYFGAASLLLASFGWVGSAHHAGWRRWRWGLLGLGCLGVVALGRYLPVVGELLPSIPGLDLLRYPVKALLLAGLPVALLAGRGVDVVIGAERPLRRKLAGIAFAATGLAAIASAALVVGLLGPLLQKAFDEFAALAAHGLVWPFVRSTIILAGVALVVVAGPRLSANWRVSVLVLLVAFDLVGAAAEALPFAPSRTLTDVPPVLRSIRSEIGGGRLFRDRDPEAFVVPLASDRAWASAAWWQRILDGSLAANWGAPMIYQSDAEVLAGRRMAVLARETMAAPWRDRLTPLRIGGVSLVMTPDQPRIDGLRPVAAERVEGGIVYRLFSVDRTLGVGWLPDARTVATEIDALRSLFSPSFDPALEVIRETDAPRSSVPGAMLARLLPEAELWRGSIDAPTEGFLVTSFVWHPDLHFEIDGRVVAAEQVNFAFAGSSIAAGVHQVRVLFAPRSVVWGGLISASFALLLSVSGLLGWLSRTRRLRSRKGLRA